MSRIGFSEKRLLKLVPSQLGNNKLGNAVDDSITQLEWLRASKREANRKLNRLIDRVDTMVIAKKAFEDEQVNRG